MVLAEKIDETRELLRRVVSMANAHHIAVAWTGGKDSTVALYLWQQFLREHGPATPSFLALSVDTGVKFPEVLAFRDRTAQQWGVDLQVARSGLDPDTYPVAGDPVQCCTDLKIRPLQEAVRRLGIEVLITGVRGDEHPERTKRSWQERKHDPEYITVHPLLSWTELDIWTFTLEQNIPYCSLYDSGYRSLGCRPCTEKSVHAERSGRNQEKERSLDTLHGLGYF